MPFIDRLYARRRARYLQDFVAAYLAAGFLMTVLAVVTFALFEPLSPGHGLRLLGEAWGALLLSQASGSWAFLKSSRPLTGWLGRPPSGEGAGEAWRTAIDLPWVALQLALWRSILLTGIPLTAVVAAEFDFPLGTTALFFIGLLGAAIYPALLFYFLLELMLRPVLRDIAVRLPSGFEVPVASVSLRRKVLVAVPLINVVSGGFVGILATATTGGSLVQLGQYVVFSILIAFTASLIPTWLVARSLMTPIDDLLGATRRIAEGDLSSHAPIVSGDEMGVLASSFNAMTADMLQSRQRLVEAIEEERRRLRRDLHDGLGPTLAAVILQLDTARRLLRKEPESADQLLAELRRETQVAVDDIRRLVYALRPPALDELGLVRAIRERAATFAVDSGRGSLAIEVVAPEELPPLPAAVEVAAYRIVQEALTNVARHSGAAGCRVEISCNGGLDVEISDDGRGLAAGLRHGVGLSSMRERAAEVGGTCEVSSSGGLGTRVVARLPLT